jgi:hypothetical protein
MMARPIDDANSPVNTALVEKIEALVSRPGEISLSYMPAHGGWRYCAAIQGSSHEEDSPNTRHGAGRTRSHC